MHVAISPRSKHAAIRSIDPLCRLAAMDIVASAAQRRSCVYQRGINLSPDRSAECAGFADSDTELDGNTRADIAGNSNRDAGCYSGARLTGDDSAGTARGCAAWLGDGRAAAALD
jgi:hypothetical protein